MVFGSDLHEIFSFMAKVAFATKFSVTMATSFNICENLEKLLIPHHVNCKLIKIQVDLVNPLGGVHENKTPGKCEKHLNLKFNLKKANLLLNLGHVS